MNGLFHINGWRRLTLRPGRRGPSMTRFWRRIAPPGLGLIGAAATLALILAAGSFGASPAALAQDPPPSFLDTAPGTPDPDGNRLPNGQPRLRIKKLERREVSPVCPGNSLTLTFFFPQGFDRPGPDEDLAGRIAEELKREAAEFTKDGFCPKEDCGSRSCGAWTARKTVAVYQPSPDYVSILFTDYSFTGGAHPNTTYTALTYDLTTGQPLTLAGLFPDRDRALPRYWEWVYSHWCSRMGYKFPLHFQNLQPCNQADVPDAPDTPAPPDTYVWASTLDDLGRLVFTPQGASLVLGPYESGSYASGTVILDLPRDEFIALGASPALWGIKPAKPAE